MTSKSFFLKSVSVLGLAGVLSQPALAMTCVEFSELDEETQMQMLEEMDAEMGGREAARDEGRGADEGVDTDASFEVSTEDKADAEGGQEAQHEAGRGAELIATVKQGCEENPESDVESLISPTQ